MDAAAARTETVRKSVRVWTGQLVDLTARNNLLYYRDLAVGTLDLAAAADEVLYGVLSGRATLLSRLFPDGDESAGTMRRARAIRNRAQEHFEERALSAKVR